MKMKSLTAVSRCLLTAAIGLCCVQAFLTPAYAQLATQDDLTLELEIEAAITEQAELPEPTWEERCEQLLKPYNLGDLDSSIHRYEWGSVVVEANRNTCTVSFVFNF